MSEMSVIVWHVLNITSVLRAIEGTSQNHHMCKKTSRGRLWNHLLEKKLLAHGNTKRFPSAKLFSASTLTTHVQKKAGSGTLWRKTKTSPLSTSWPILCPFQRCTPDVFFVSRSASDRRIQWLWQSPSGQAQVLKFAAPDRVGVMHVARGLSDFYENFLYMLQQLILSCEFW